MGRPGRRRHSSTFVSLGVMLLTSMLLAGVAYAQGTHSLFVPLALANLAPGVRPTATATPPGSLPILFVSDRLGSSNNTFTMDGDGSNQQVLLADNANLYSHLAWSPDGSRLAFISDREAGDRVCLYVMDADGMGRVQLTFSSSFSAYHPTWSHDGSRIAFQRASGSAEHPRSSPSTPTAPTWCS